MSKISNARNQTKPKRPVRSDIDINNRDDFMNQYKSMNKRRDYRPPNTKRKKRRLHWLEITVITLGAITASVVIVFVVLAITYFSSSDSLETYATAYIQDNDGSFEYSYDNDNFINSAESESPSGNVATYDTEVIIGDCAEFYYETDEHDENYAIYEANESNYISVDSNTDNVNDNHIDLVNNFRQFDFFLESNVDKYIAFRYENQNLSYEDIVWKVNAGLYRDFFENPNIYTGAHPFLVNPFNRLPYDFTPYRLERVAGTDFLLTPETIRAFNAFRDYARTHGHDLWVASAYRTISHQRDLYARSGSRGTIARPGHSEHHTGRAIDLGGPLGLLDRWQEYPTSATALWVVDNAYRFGFIIRYTIENRHITGILGEPWHITYVTEEVSRTIQSAGYGSLEEFVARNPHFVFRP